MIFTNNRKIICLACIFSMAGCAAVYDLGSKIPGLDRILYQSSKAEVGPVKTQAGEIVDGTQAEPSLAVQLPTPTTQPETVAKPVVKIEQKSPKPVVVQAKKHSLKGKVKVTANGGLISAEGVFVQLERVDGTPLRKQTEQKQHEIDMLDKIYAPGQLVVRKGDTVNFINSDQIKHNVFSSSGENAFDLGTFGAGLQRGVKLNEEGIVKVYCNIHPKMAAFVAVDDTGITHELNTADGTFEFSDLASGEYKLTLWSVRGEQTQTLFLNDEQSLALDLTFDTSSYKASTHPNKFGEAYKKPERKREYY